MKRIYLIVLLILAFIICFDLIDSCCRIDRIISKHPQTHLQIDDFVTIKTQR